MPAPALARSRLVRVLVTILLLALVAWKVDVSAVLSHLVGIEPGALGVATALGFLAYLGRAWRWRLLLHRAGVGVSLAAAYRLTLVGVFYGVFTPGRAGEVAKVAHLRTSVSRALPSVFWERITDVVLLEILALPWFLTRGTVGPLSFTYMVMVLATVGVVAAGSSPGIPRWVVGRWPHLAGGVGDWSRGSGGILVSRALLLGLAGGVAFFAVNFTGAFGLAVAVSPGVGPGILLLFPVIILLGNLPVAFGGLGLREAVAASAFAREGLDPAAGPALSLAWFACVTLIPGVLGFVVQQLAARPARDRRDEGAA